MESGEENTAATSKRPRAPLSPEDNVLLPPEMPDGQKRRRLESAGQENRSPKPSSSGRRAELDVKPDTPAINSVRSRLQQLSQTRPGVPVLARAESDPGAGGSPSVSVFLQDFSFRQHLLGEGEFNQRLERFKAPLFEASTAASPAGSCPLSLSKFVSDIHQKIQGNVTPSFKEASRIRQEREQEVRLLVSQPITNNAWLKRSNSDPSLAEQGKSSPGPSSDWKAPTRSRRIWPPSQSWNQVDGDAEMKDGSYSEDFASSTEKVQPKTTEAELNSHDEANTAEMIDEMFGEVLEYAGKMDAERKRGDADIEDHDSGISTCSGGKDKMDSEKEKSEGDEDVKEEQGCEELHASRDELTFPPTGILSPLSKSLEAVVTPMRLAVSQLSNPPSLLLTPDKLTTPPAESSPLYSIDAYRTQRQSKLPTFQSVTPEIQRKAQEKSRPQQSINVKDKILALNEEAAKLQKVISQTLQALSCCTDEEHGRGSATEAEAEKILLVSCEKRAALLAEVARLREERLLESEEAATSLKPCRGTVGISNIQLPLKVEFVYSSRNRTGQPSHYFFVLIRYGPYNIVASPLATAADAKNGDTISFPTSVTLKDIRSNFEIDVEVYSLSHTSGNTCNMESSSIKPRVTPRKLLSTIMQRSSNSMTSATLPIMNTRRSSNFCLVGSHKITLASLGQSKFPLDKMKFEGKIRRLLGDEFQEKVPFLSPLEGNIYLYLESQSHSNVQHQGFLSMFEVIKEFGVWHRRFFVLDGHHMYYWNHPNDRESKAPEGSILLSSSSSRCVKPVKRDSCARPFTFELASNTLEQKQDDDSQGAAAKCWFSADTKEERFDWMEKLNQVLLDIHTWSQPTQTKTETKTQLVKACSSRSMRESSL